MSTPDPYNPAPYYLPISLPAAFVTAGKVITELNARNPGQQWRLVKQDPQAGTLQYECSFAGTGNPLDQKAGAYRHYQTKITLAIVFSPHPVYPGDLQVTMSYSLGSNQPLPLARQLTNADRVVIDTTDCLNKTLANQAACEVYNQGMALFNAGIPQQAVVSFRKAIQVWPYDADFYMPLAAALQSLCDLAGAEQVFRDATSVCPGSWMAWYNLGCFLAQSQRRQEARQALQTALQNQPDATSQLEILDLLKQL